MKSGTRLKMGIILVIASQLLGWGGIAFFCSLALKTRKPGMCLFGTILYAVSWGLLGLCIVLVGAEGIQYIRNLLKKPSIAAFFRSARPKKNGHP
jgi:hypothetical protein